MANAMSDYLEAKVLGWLTQGSAMPAAPTNVYVGLFTALPGDTGTSGAPSDGAEVTAANGYARVAVSTAGGFSAISASTSKQHATNASTVTFPQASGSWGTVIGYGLWDASSAGNLLFYASVTSQAITSSMTPSLAAGQIDCGMD